MTQRPQAPARHAHSHALTLAAGLALAAASASAQTAIDPDRALAPVRDEGTKPVTATLPIGLEWLSQLDGMELDLPQPALLPEGRVLVRRRGEVIEPRPGVWVFKPDLSDRQPGERAMVLMPSRVLSRLSQFSGPDAISSTFTLTGTVYRYRGMNLLLPTAFAPVLADETPAERTPPTDPAATPTEASTAPDPTTQPASSEADPEIDALLNEFDDATPNTPGAARGLSGELSGNLSNLPIGNDPADPTSVPSDRLAPMPADPNAPEDSLLSRQVGRVVRIEDGRFGFAVDHGPNRGPGGPNSAGGMIDRPRPQKASAYTIQYCRALQDIEAYALAWGDELRLEMSGRLMSFEGRAYLLPTVYRVLPPSDLDPMP